jgi:hypothetical protein
MTNSLPRPVTLSPPSSPTLTSSTSSTPVPTTPTSNPTSENALQKTRKRTNESKKDLKSKARFNRNDLEIILSWLEHAPNFESIYGTQKTSIGQPVKTSIQSFNTLAAIVNKQNKNRLNLNGKSLKERFERHRALHN